MCVFEHLCSLGTTNKITKQGKKIQKTLSGKKMLLMVLLSICVFVIRAKKSQPKRAEKKSLQPTHSESKKISFQPTCSKWS